jgi:MoxR-like ATPase
MSTPVGSGSQQINQEDAVQRVAQARQLLMQEVHKIIIGQEEMIEQMLICIFAKGHCLTIGVPGLAKTLTVSTLSQALAMKFTRIQFTPDLMPSDITGTEIIDQDQATGQRAFRFVQGPVFSNIVLADEINRTPPKTQAALLQAMQEYEVSSAGKTYSLEQPFFVMATQNPIEQEGTYPLPEAQLDRFMLSINIGYPTRDEERDIVLATTQTTVSEIKPVLNSRDVIWIQQLVRQVPASRHMIDYAVDLVRATRPKESGSPDFIHKWLAWGAGPRAAQNIVLTAKAHAILKGRFAVSAADIRAMAYPVLRHRIFTNFNADAEGVDVDTVIEKLLLAVPEPTYGDAASAVPRKEHVPARKEQQTAASVPNTASPPEQEGHSKKKKKKKRSATSASPAPLPPAPPTPPALQTPDSGPRIGPPPTDKRGGSPPPVPFKPSGPPPTPPKR